MKPRRRFFIILFILFVVCLAILAGLSDLASRPRNVQVAPVEENAPVEESAIVGAPPGAVFPPAPPDQASTIRFERITAEDGLSQNAVLAIAQDRQGFMWFGTEGGLNKYDGYRFIVYKHDSDDPSTLSDDFVSSIYEDRGGDLWVGTRNGLNRFDRATGTFTRYQHDPSAPQSLGGSWVVAIYEDCEGTLWVGIEDGGLDQLDRDTDSFIHYRHDAGDPNTLSDDTVRAIYEDDSGGLWIATHGGINRFDRATGIFTHYLHDPDDPQSLSGSDVSTIFEDHQGALWIGTEDGGLNQIVLSKDEGIARSSETFVRYQHDPDDPRSLSHDRVRAVFEDSAGRLWIGTQNGLDLFDRGRDQFVHYRHNASDPYSLSSNSIWSIYEDRTGILWFGTYGGGLSKYNRTTDQFALYQHNPDLPNSLSDNMIWSICQDRSGILWIGTFNGGLNRLDRESGTFTVYRHDPDDPTSLGSDDVRAVLDDREGTLWVGTHSGGLGQFDPGTETFSHYRHDHDDPHSLSEDRVTVMYQDRGGSLWIGTRAGGLNRLDRATETFTRYQHDPDDASSLSDDRVWAIYEDRSGALWVGTLGGINLLDVATGRFTHYVHDSDDPQSLSNDQAFSFYEDPTGAVWIGTWGSGLDRFDRATQTFAHYTEKDGLPDNVIYGIEVDAEGFLWLSTNQGLSKFDPGAETFQNYDVRNGLQNNEFNVGAHFTSESGEMFFGGIQGFNGFYPEQVMGNPHVPPIVVTAFSKFNEVVRRDLSPNEHIQLSYRDNFISFEFAALDYTAPDKNQYAYMLEGQDQDWIYARTRRHADYTNLRGGDYVFRVKGSNNDGVWNEEGVAIYLTVTPPIWETWWFRGSVILVLAGSLIGGYRLRVRSVEARSRELENQVEERTHEIEQRTQELEALYRADEELYRHLRLDEVLQVLVDIAVDILQASKSSLMIWDAGRERLVVRAAHGFSPETMAQMSFALGEGVVGRVAASREPIVVEDVSTDPRIAGRITGPEGIRSFMHVPIEIGGQIFGVFNVNYAQPRAFGGEEQRLFLALAQRAALAIENAQLYEQAQELAVVEERQRLARDLHDAVTQTLFSASLIAEVLPRLWERDPDVGRHRLEEVRQLTRGALAEMRTLLLELRPSALVEAELGDLLRQLAEATTGRARVPVVVEVEIERSLPPDVKVALYRIAQEALNNVAKHAGASQATVSLRCASPFPSDFGGEQRGGVELRISDDGRGFDPDSIPPDHLGVGIMRERAEAIGATLTVESEIGHGTEVMVVWTADEGRNPET
ncbi:MAG: GAF domain-containing protein [Anaerolineae bacterium]|nr:GAF domain-containing protein [Anaerolineae bacterium]